MPLTPNGKQNAQEARQDTRDNEPAREPAGQENTTPPPSYAAGTVVSVQAIAACPPVDQPGPDDRKPEPSTSTTQRKSRRRRGT